MPNNQIDDWQEIPITKYNLATQQGKLDAVLDVFTPQEDPGDWQDVPESIVAANQEKSGFFSRVGQDYDKRIEAGNTIAENQVTGKIGPVSATYQFGAKGLGMVGDVAKEGFESISDTIPKSVKDYASSKITSAFPIASAFMKSAPRMIANSDTAKIGKKLYGKFAVDHPEAASNIAATGDVAGGLIGATAIAPTLEVANILRGPAGELLSKAGTSVMKSADNKSILSQVDADKLTQFSTEAYQAAHAKGMNIASEYTDNWLDKASKAIPQTEEGRLALGDTGSTQLIERIQALRGKPISFAGAEEIDKGLGAEITKAYRSGDKEEAARLIKVQDGLREAVSSLPEASEELRKAKGLWSAASNQRQIETILRNSEFSDNPATAIRMGFRNLAKKVNDNPRGWSPEEVKAINGAAKTGIATDALKVAGSRLGPIIAGAAGAVSGGPIAGAAAGAANYAASSTARGAAGALQAVRANKVSNAIKQRPVVKQAIQDAAESGDLAPKFTAQKGLGYTLDKAGQLLRHGRPTTFAEISKLPPKEAMAAFDEIKLLPAPQKDILVNEAGTARFATGAEELGAQEGRQHLLELGMSPDILKTIDDRQVMEILKQGGGWRGDIAVKNRKIPMKKFE